MRTAKTRRPPCQTGPFETPAQLGKQLDLPVCLVAALGLLAGDRFSLLLVAATYEPGDARS